MMLHQGKRISRLLILPVIAALGLTMSPAAAQDEVVLTIDVVRQRALEHNRDYLSAQEEIRKADAEVVVARSGALPTISAFGDYTRNLSLGSQFITIDDTLTQEFQFGFKNSFSAGISLRQSLWQGGKVFTALEIAKQYKKYSRARASEIEAEATYNAEVLFYSVVLSRSRLEVLEKALEANSYNLEVVEKKYSQGMVSEFEVLRARVEKNNLLPQILEAESNVELAEKRLKSFLGLELDQSVKVIDRPDDTVLADLNPLEFYVDEALTSRPAVNQADLLTDITNRAIRVAQGDFLPSVEAVSAYTWSSGSDAFRLSENNTRSFTAGIQVSIPIFTGGERFGELTRSKADHTQAQLAARQVRDDVRLQVEEAYDQLVQARKSLDIQDVNISEAEEGLKIANVRYESGVGTLLEVLSAQVALTQARTSRAAALFSFREARAQLKRASTIQPGNGITR